MLPLFKKPKNLASMSFIRLGKLILQVQHDMWQRCKRSNPTRALLSLQCSRHKFSNFVGKSKSARA